MSAVAGFVVERGSGIVTPAFLHPLQRLLQGGLEGGSAAKGLSSTYELVNKSIAHLKEQMDSHEDRIGRHSR